VRINAINPGATMTGRIREALALEAESEGRCRQQGARRRANRRCRWGRYADPADIARVALFLAFRPRGYVTGAIIPMDGGLNPII